MLYNRITTRDLEQYFYKTLFLYSGRPVFCSGVGEGNLTIFDIETQESFKIVFDPQLCTPLQDRIGMVNCEGQVAYVARQPMRRFKIGICGENTTFTNVGTSDVAYKLMGLHHKSLLDSINNKYPSLEEALNSDKKAVAFDKQFAISGGVLFYRLNAVGYVRNGKIEFRGQYQYLDALIGKKYGNNRKNFRI